MTRRRALVAGLVGLLALLWASAALGKDRGLNVFENAAPGDDIGGLAAKYPISHYQIDFHVDTTTSIGVGPLQADVPDPSSLGVTAPEGLAQMTWTLISSLMRGVIEMFAAATSVDLINGPHGALTTISQTTQRLHDGPLGGWWVPLALLMFGVWAASKMAEQDMAGMLRGTAMMFAAVTITSAIILFPRPTVGYVADLANQAKVGFLSLPLDPARDPSTGGQQARTSVADYLTDAFLRRPFAMLQTGALVHCVGRQTDTDGFPVPTDGPQDPASTVCHDHLKLGADGHGDYADKFLELDPGSPEREALYEALRDGQAPPHTGLRLAGTPDPFAGYSIDKTDAPAVDMQQAGHAGTRFAWTMAIAAGLLPVIAVLGVAIFLLFLTQVAFLFLLLWAPVAALAAFIPGPGHRFFWGWLHKIGATLILGPAVSLVIGTLTVMGSALLAATAVLGFLMSWGLTVGFFLLVWVMRKRMLAKAIDRPLIARSESPAVRAAAGAATIATAPVAAVREYRQRERTEREQVTERRSSATAQNGERPPGDKADGRSEGPRQGPVQPSDVTAGTYQRNGQEGEKMAAGSFRQDMEAAYRERMTRDKTPEAKPATPEPAQRNGTPPEPAQPRSFHESLSEERGRRKDAAIVAALAPPAAPEPDSGRTRPDGPPAPPRPETRPQAPERVREPERRD